MGRGNNESGPEAVGADLAGLALLVPAGIVVEPFEVKGILGVDELADPAIIEFLRGKIREAVGDLS